MTKYINACFNEDCIDGCRKRIPDASIDLIVTDPPYGIQGETLHKHYNRNEAHVLKGYTEIPLEEYPEFTRRWITEAERILRPGGSLYIVSGYTNLIAILNALQQTSLTEMNHIIWKYSFGVYTKKKFVSSHYHILFYTKPGAKHTFNTFARHSQSEKSPEGSSMNYLDREDVWVIPKEYKPGKVKNKNELPTTLLKKILQYSSNEGDLVCDLFLGGFSTALVAKAMNRNYCGFEVNPKAFAHNKKKLAKVEAGSLLLGDQAPASGELANQGKPWRQRDLDALLTRYDALMQELGRKTEVIRVLSGELGRGRFSLTNALKRVGR